MKRQYVTSVYVWLGETSWVSIARVARDGRDIHNFRRRYMQVGHKSMERLAATIRHDAILGLGRVSPEADGWSYSVNQPLPDMQEAE